MLFLDEPSAGLDPQARLEIHELVLDLRREQRTILMTTHYIEEAEKLCDRVAIVDEGRIVAMGTPREIQERVLAHSTIEIELATPLGDVSLPQWPLADQVARGRAAHEDFCDHRTPRAHRGRHGQVARRKGRRTVRHTHQAAVARGRLHRTYGKEPAGMKVYLALFKNNMRLTLRDRGVLFFNYLFPLIFFFGFAEMFHAGVGAGIAYFVSTVLVMGILGNGLWGAGMRSVQEREANILRRFKVTPISPLPILVAAMLSGWLLFLPVLILLVGLAHFLYAMPIPPNWFSLFLMASLGVCSLRAIGLILAAVTNTMDEATIAIQSRLHADAVPERRHGALGDAAQVGADRGAIHAGLVPGQRLPGHLLPQSESLGQRARRWPRCCSPRCSACSSPCSSSAGRRKKRSGRAISSG